MGLRINSQCKTLGKGTDNINCNITFDAFTSNVDKFGDISRGSFEGDPDVAGAGVFRAFTVLSVFVMSMGLVLGLSQTVSLFYFRKRKPYRYRSSMSVFNKTHIVIDNFIISSADTQLLLILAIGAAFYSTERCTTSLYHYLVLHHMVCIGMWTTLLAFVLSRSPFTSFFASFFRLAVLLPCAIVLRKNNGLTKKDARGAESRIKVPGISQTDSILILPASCLLNSSNNPFDGLSDPQRQNLANDGISREFTDQTLIILIASATMCSGFLVAILLKYLFRKRRREILRGASRSEKGAWNQKARLRFCFTLLANVSTWCAILPFIIHNWVVIGALRRWVDQSVWLNREDGKGNPESSFHGVGQVAPLAALGAGGFALLGGIWDHFKEYRMFEWLSGYYADEYRDGEESERARDSISLVSNN